MPNHRNSQPRYYDTDYVYFITVNTQDQYAYFQEELLCELWMEELKFCKSIRAFELYAFCLNYDHFHMLVKPGKDDNISKIMQNFKRHFSRNANIVLGANPESDIRECRRQGGRYENLSEDVYKHDRKIIDFRKKFFQKYGAQSFVIPKFKWQQSFHDHVIRDDSDLDKHWNYTAYNFQKHEYMPEEWHYSSLNYPKLIDQIVSETSSSRLP